MSLPAALTIRDRIDRVMTIVATEVGPVLLRDRRLTSVTIYFYDSDTTVGALSASGAKLDVAACCVVIERAPARYFAGIQQRARRLRLLRNELAHMKRELEESDAVRAASDAQQILLHFGLTKAASAVLRFREGPTIRYATALRNYLAARAGEPDPLVSYDRALDEMSEAIPGITMSVLIRQLNVLAALQMLLGEPQLCALVVLANDNIPGDGFFWSIDVEASESREKKQAAHGAELAKIRRFDWRVIDEANALPW